MSLHKGVCFLLLISLCAVCDGYGQAPSSPDTLHGNDLSEIVVTATRSERKLADVPIPVAIIGQEQIQSTGASRLDELLSEQTGLAIINDHGFGVQMQGMDPEYCLILINGEPVIGRTAGTLDLTRITVSHVQRIEIIKGPSSSLYGSDALAGVINIITNESDRTGIGLQAKYGAHNTSDNTLGGSLALGQKGNAGLSVNRYYTGGYDLMPRTYGKTVDPYTDYTFRGGIHYRLTPRLELDIDGQYFSEVQQNNYLATSGKDSVIVQGDGKVTDKRISPVIKYKASQKWKLTLRNYWSRYKTNNDLYDATADTAYDDAYFQQDLWKEELQSEHVVSSNQILTLGSGFSRESVQATRYAGKEILSNYFFYAQHEWHPTPRWNILSGLRFDAPSAYHAQLSPKIAAQYSLNSHWSFRVSAGTGYRAPDFRQLYLTFSNPIVGYSVLGTKEVKNGLAEMQQEGQIAQVYVDPEKADAELRPESSVAYNAGGTYTAAAGWNISLNLFRNDIKDLIDTRTIAMKTNGRPLYSYYNIHRVFTQGAELDGSLPLFNERLIVSAGYQFLLARDKEVVKDIRHGEAFIRDPETLETRKLTMAEYGGLFNRSRHTANLKVRYANRGWSVNARVIYHSRFGFADRNGDNILDAGNEYAPGYALCNLDLGRSFWSDKLSVQAGVKDLFDYKDPEHLSHIPGRTWYIGASLNLFKTNHNNLSKH